jgi:hypothetical protein
VSGSVQAVRLFAGILFWVGLFGVAREWLYARRRGVRVSRSEKAYLVTALPLIFGAQLALDLIGVAPAVATTVSGLAMGIALNGWALMRRMRRTNS